MAVKTSTRTPTKSTETKIDFMKAANDIGKPVAAVIGFVGGKYIVKKFQKSQTVSGLMGADAKAYFVPVAVALGGLAATQLKVFKKNDYAQLALIGVAGSGVNAIIEKATGKTLLQGLEGILGDEDYTDYEDVPNLQALNPITQELPAADIDIEQEIQRSISGAADFSISDEPIGSTVTDYNMSDEPIGKTNYPDNEEEEIIEDVGKIKDIDPDSMDYDIFSGDMMES